MSLKKKKIVIGLLGKIGSGKSTCAEVLRGLLGAKVIDADQIAHGLLARSDVKARLKKRLGLDHISRAVLSKEVFTSKRRLRALEAVLHPRIKAEMARRLRQVKKGVVVIDAPLLLEKKLDSWCDYLLYIDCRDSRRFRRLSTKALGKRVDKRDVKQRERNQISALMKRKKADYIINNNGTAADLLRQLRCFADFLGEVDK